MWVFLQRTKDDPCAIDLADGNVVEFVTTAIRAPWRRGPEIQSRIIIPHAQAAMFMIGSSYFWLNLATGEHVRFKTDYSLHYFDEKQLVAVFTENGRPESHRAVDMRTGRNVLEIPNRFKSPFIPFYWPDTTLAQPVQAYCAYGAVWVQALARRRAKATSAGIRSYPGRSGNGTHATSV